jgi:hypothetical protein
MVILSASRTVWPALRQLPSGLEKIPQAGEFNDLLRRQDGGDQLTLGAV